MDWECIYLASFRVDEDEETGKKSLQDAKVRSGLDQKEDEGLGSFLGSLIRQMKAKRTSLSPSAACRAYAFAGDSLGEEDEKVCDQLLHAVSVNQFQSFAQILASKYLHSPKCRKGILFIVNANIEIKKNRSPALFVFKTDFQPGFIPDDSGIHSQDEIILPELKKGLVYPHFDGANFQFKQLVLFQRSSSDYFQRMLRLETLPDSEEIADEALEEELEQDKPGAYERYFKIPEDERRSKREVFGPARVVQEQDLMDPDHVSHLSRRAQMRVVDHNSKPVRLRLQIDDGLKFEGKSDLLNQSYFFAREGTEKFLIIRGHKFETKSHFQTVEFMQLETLDDVMKRIAADRLSESGSSEEDE